MHLKVRASVSYNLEETILIEWNHYCARGLHLFYGGCGCKELGYLCKVCNKSGGDVWQVEHALMLLPFYPVGGHRMLDGEEPRDILLVKKIDIVRDISRSVSDDRTALDFVLALLPVYAAVGLIGVSNPVLFLLCILIAFALWHFSSWRKRSLVRLLFALETIEAEYEGE